MYEDVEPEKQGHYSLGQSYWPGLAKVMEECSELSEVMAKIIENGGKVRFTPETVWVQERLPQAGTPGWMLPPLLPLRDAPEGQSKLHAEFEPEFGIEFGPEFGPVTHGRWEIVTMAKLMQYTGRNLLREVLDEIADVEAAIDFFKLINADILDQVIPHKTAAEYVADRREQKQNQFSAWHKQHLKAFDGEAESEAELVDATQAGLEAEAEAERAMEAALAAEAEKADELAKAYLLADYSDDEVVDILQAKNPASYTKGLFDVGDALRAQLAAVRSAGKELPPLPILPLNKAAMVGDSHNDEPTEVCPLCGRADPKNGVTTCIYKWHDPDGLDPDGLEKL